MNKTDLLKTVADAAGITRAQAGLALEALAETAEKELKAGNDFVAPGLVRFKVIAKPAQGERVGVNPFTKLSQTFAAKPASRAVKAYAVPTIKKSVA